ncbi:MAG: response regulator [Planctomycetes bacterium]|nr:response regulator [Planctomycetota bacterium]
MNVSIEPDVLSQSVEEPVIGRRRLKVLLVEDYPTVRNAIVKVLKSIHLEVVEAKNGIEALQILDNQSVDMVFTDLVMPEMDGFELCEEIRRRPAFRRLPIVVVSTHRDAAYVIQALRCGADDYLNKPFPASLAQRVIERIMSHA